MPYNGSGTYSAPSSPGAFKSATSGQPATPAAWNALLADIEAALSMVITSDGQSPVSQDIPFDGHKLTEVGNATAATDAVNAGQLAASSFTGANDTGAVNAYAIAPAIAITAYAAYQRFQFTTTNANTGAATLAVSGLAAKAIKHLDGTDLLTGDLLAGEIVDVMYDGTNFQLLSATGLRGVANTWRAAQTFNAATTLAATATMTGAALNEAKGANIASATTTDIGAATGNYVHITGTTAITGLGTIQAGTRRKVVFDGILTLTHNATSLILPTGANITTAAGDCAEFESEGSGNWRCTSYERADGTALTTVTSSLATTGWAKLPGGLIMQWGTSGSIASGATEAETFTPNFASACYGVHLQTTGAGAPGAGDNMPYPSALSTTGFTINNRLSYTTTFYWWAYGK